MNKTRILVKKFQKAYYKNGPQCDEYYMSLGLSEKMDETHEILHGSRKTYEDWNMINLSRSVHSLAHDGRVTKRELFIAKFKTGGARPPADIIREFDLQEFWGEE
jgi:hypothetical protein